MSAFKLEKNGIYADLVFDTPSLDVNLLSSKVLEELNTLLDELKKDNNIKLMFIKSAKKDVFIAGADISEIKELRDEDAAYEIVRRGQMIIRKISTLPFISVAVIDGATLGGGLEFALNCDYRLATQNEKTSIGLPEVNLGVLPGFSGTQVMKNTIGTQKALELILGSKLLSGAKAEKLKLVDWCVPKGYLDFKINSLKTELLDAKLKAKIDAKKYKKTFFEKYLSNVIFHFAHKTVMQKTKGKYEAPLKVITLFKETQGMNIDEALSMEARYFAQLSITSTSKNLINLFFISEDLKKDSGVDENVETLKLNNTAVIGAGTMGAGIVWLLSKIDLNVRLKTRGYKQIADAFKVINKSYDAIMKRRRLTQREVDLKKDHITFDTEFRGFEYCDLAIEAIVENVEAKKDIYKILEDKMEDEAIIATNTSSLSITNLAKGMKNPSRFVGMHFFNPVALMPLVEVIAGEKTSLETIATIVKLAKKAKKTPIVVGDCAGFVVNRILLPYINESAKLLEEGAGVKNVDYIIEDFGMPMGPFTLADTVGLDVGFKVASVLEEAYGERMKVSTLLKSAYNDLNLLGKKGKKGFYVYEGKEQMLNSQITNLIHSHKDFSDQEIIDRTMFIMINEASRILEEGMIKNASYLDMAMVMGTGFPPFRGGILRYADSLGIEKVYSTLKKLEDNYGSRFAPSELIVSMFNDSKNFYEE